MSFPELDQRYHNVDQAVSNTCQWFLDHAYYRRWEHTTSSAASHRLLWLRGKPGSGKSTILKRALQDARSKRLAQTASNSRADLVACFFFNTRGSFLESTPQGFYRGVLVQIFEHQDLALDSEHLKAFLRKRSLLAEGVRWTIGELKDMFRSALARLSLDLVLYVDALDECDAATNRDLVDHLCEELNRARHNGVNLKICISSRHYPNIHGHDCRTIIAEKYNYGDIMAYAKDKLETIANKTQMAQQITEQSSGIFLWAVLVIRKLREAIDDGEPHSALLRILASTPRDLGEVFETLLGSISDEAERKQSLTLLLFVLCAKRSLNLQELGLALAFTTQYKSQDDYRCGPDFVSMENLERLIVKRSRGLIEVARFNEVQFIHASVKDFLLENGTLLLPHLSCREEVLATANNELARSCFNFLRVDDPWDFDAHSCFNSRRVDNLWDFGRSQLSVFRHPLVEYAAEYAFKHAKDAEAAGISQAYIAEVLMLKLLQGAEPQRLLDVFQFPYNFRAPYYTNRPLKPLSTCCLHHLVSVIEVLLTTAPSTVAAVLDLDEALGVAVKEGHEAVIRALIPTGVSLDHNRSIFESPVYAAVEFEKTEALRALLQAGANPNAFGTCGSALSLAVSKQNVEQIRTLLRHNAKPCFGDGNGPPLLTATSGGHQAIVALLLDHGASVASRGCYSSAFRGDETTHALEEASIQGHVAVLADLLQAAGRQCTPEEYYEDAFYAASGAGHVQSVALIRDAAKARGFAADTARPWYYNHINSPEGALAARSRRKITLDIKMLRGKRISIQIQGCCLVTELKQVLQDRHGGMPTDFTYLINRRNFRPIKDGQRLFEAGIGNGSSIEVTLPFRSMTTWVENEMGNARALWISAEEAGLPPPPDAVRWDFGLGSVDPRSSHLQDPHRRLRTWLTSDQTERYV